MKNKYFIKKPQYLLCLAVTVVLCGCKVLGPTIASYDQYAYTQTTSLKVDALNLMDSSIYNYQSETRSIATVKLNIQKLYEYDRNRAKDTITLKQWKILMDTNGHLLGGFLVYRRKNKVVPKMFIDDVKVKVGASFDQIAKLEGLKNKTN
jgi:hypothetical protein